MTTYEWSDRIDDLERSRTFVLSILFQAILNENLEQTKEFRVKLEMIDEELNQLLKCTT